MKSVQFNGILWQTVYLGEHTILLTTQSPIKVRQIHQTSNLLQEHLKEYLIDIVPSYRSIALHTAKTKDEIINMLDDIKKKITSPPQKNIEIKIPICYEMGLDLQHISSHNKISVYDLIQKHLQGHYRVDFIGFTPGFIYASGLDSALVCPRKTSPRKYLPSGSVGIGGNQIGIYPLDSPGGWNIVGRTPLKLFDIKKMPPLLIDLGTHFTFYRISQKEFKQWEKS